MNTRTSTRLLLLLVLGSVGCNQKSEVREEVKDLEQARQESPSVAQDLRQELDQKKAEVAKLEEKLALAERGVTDRVVQERKELNQAVQRQENDVRREVKEAQSAAQAQSADAERARRELEATKNPGRVETQVQSDHKVVPSNTDVEVKKQQEQVPIETTRTIERGTEQRAPTPTPQTAPTP
ncbi:MAG TPA: hypothetical protein VJR89_03375 [Polyangiales bacterium]|nr:hypothetical protein [Polyangiales bacterium]